MLRPSQNRPARAAVSVLAALGVACSLAAGPAVGHETQNAAAQIQWEDCPEQVTEDNAECGSIEVPTYYDNPSAGTISVGFLRVPAANPQAKRGVLFGNPGGPGGDGYSYFGSEQFAWPEGIVNEWDRVAVQPRGLPGSTPVECTQPGGSDFDAATRAGAYIRNSCEKSTPGYTNSLTTENTARDWEMVRQALGEDRISIMGLSYGTLLGSTYASFYPQHTDKVVLDSAMSPARAWNGTLADQQSGYENALHDFFDYVAANDATYHLGTTPLQAYEAWSRKVAREAGVRPTVLPPDAKIGDLPPGLEFSSQPAANIMTATGELRVQAEFLDDKIRNPQASQTNSNTLMLTRLLVPSAVSWEALAKHIAGIEDLGGPQDPEQARKALEAQTQTQAMQNLILCNENSFPANPGLVPSYVWSTFVTQDPFTMFSSLYGAGIACNGRGPVTSIPALSGAELEHRPLQINATGDPQTPYQFHGDMARQMGSHVVTVHGPGHGHVAAGNAVVDEIVVDYLRTGTSEVNEAPGLI
ncbi:alpha/beta hydrolase [Corynebacterium confusum]